MGVTIGRTVTYGKPLVASLASMPDVVVASSQAVIDKIYLTWLDVNKLLTAFPEHVKLVGDAVIFQGPVVIISPMSLTRRHLIQCSLAIVVGTMSFLFVQVIYSLISRGGAKISFTRRSVVALIGALATGAVYYFVAGRYLPTQAGVYFGNQLPFYA
jgi:hypothetical protein